MARSWPIPCLLNCKTDVVDYCLLQSRNDLWFVRSFPLQCIVWEVEGYVSVCMRSLCSFYPDIKWPSQITIIVFQAERAALYRSNLKNCSFNNSLCIIGFLCFSSHIHCALKTFPIAFSIQINNLFSNFIIFDVLITLVCPSHPPSVLHQSLPYLLNKMIE